MTNQDTTLSAERDRPMAISSFNWDEQVNGWIAEACRHAFARFPDLRRWEMTGDVAQEAALSLLNAIVSKKVKPLSQEHLRRIAGLHVKWTFLTLARQHRRSIRSSHATPLAGNSAARVEEMRSSDLTPMPQKVDWIQFHCDVEALPGLQREVFRRVWYDEVDKSDIATELGVGIRTVQRNYRLACEKLMKTLKDFC